MKPPEPSRPRASRRSGDQAGRNASERRASLESFNVGAEPPLTPISRPMSRSWTRRIFNSKFYSAPIVSLPEYVAIARQVDRFTVLLMNWTWPSMKTQFAPSGLW